MALIATLQFGDNDNKLYSHTYNLCDVKCRIRRQHGRYYPDGQARCERMDVTVVAPGKNDLTLLDWYVRQTPLTGRVVITLANEAKMDAAADKEIFFENAVCFQMTEEYHIDDDNRRQLSLSFMADVLMTDQVTFER